MYLIKKITIICTIIISIFYCSTTYGSEKALDDGDAIYYLADGAISSVIMPNIEKAKKIFVTPKETKEIAYYINSLTCGKDSTLLFDMIHSQKKVTDYSKSKDRVTIVTYNFLSQELQTLIDMGDTSVELTSPRFSHDGTKILMCARDPKREGFYFIVKNLKNGSVISYDNIDVSITVASWSHDDKMIAVTGRDEKSEKVRIFFYDLEKRELKPWLEGKRAIFSPNGKMVAYASSDQRELIISDMDGKTIQSFDRYFVKDINEWIGNNKILFTIGHYMYENHVGIVDLEKKKIYDIKVPSINEISGMCYKPAK